jgi:hypothetical protein
MDVQVYCQNPGCGVLWGDAELVNPAYEWEPVVPHPDFAAFYDNSKNCWFCPNCGYQVPAHLIGSRTEIWLRDMSTPEPEARRPRRKRPAWMGKPTPAWKAAERNDRLFRDFFKGFTWPWW